MIKCTRFCAGEYEVRETTDIRPGVSVRVFRHPSGDWIAAANWDNYLYSDLLPTKRRAVECAKQLLIDTFY